MGVSEDMVGLDRAKELERLRKVRPQLLRRQVQMEPASAVGVIGKSRRLIRLSTGIIS